MNEKLYDYFNSICDVTVAFTTSIAAGIVFEL